MSDRPLAVGVDIGGTHIKLGVVDADGEIIDRASIDTAAQRGPDAILRSVADGIAPLLARHAGRVAGIGLGVPGVINDRGEISFPPNLPGWQIVPVATLLRPLLRTELPIAVENDANVAALAESRVGSGRDDASFLFITLGTGIGGCIIIDDAIWRGGGGGAGEVGHVSVDLNGPPCDCGSRGCAEAYIGQRYMSAAATAMLERTEHSSLHDVIARGEALTPRHIVAAADDGDEFARRYLASLGEILGGMLASVLNICDLSVVVVGGGVAQAGDHLLVPAQRSARSRALKSIADRIVVRPASLGNDAGVIGAGLLGLDAAK